MTLKELQDELAKRGAVAMVVHSMDQSPFFHVTFNESQKSADSRDARPSERAYGHESDKDLETACREALRRYDESLKETHGR